MELHNPAAQPMGCEKEEKESRMGVPHGVRRTIEIRAARELVRDALIRSTALGQIANRSQGSDDAGWAGELETYLEVP
jgi:hypothetical protein